MQSPSKSTQLNTKSSKHVHEETSSDPLIPREANWRGQKGGQTGFSIQMPGKSQGLQRDCIFTS